MRVLIVDSSSTVRRALINCLQGLKISETVQTGSGEQALAQLGGEGKFDLVITDLALTPEMTGLEFLKRIKRDSKLTAIPVIVVSSNSESTTIIETLRAGASSYVLRPFSQDVLQAKIRSALNPAASSGSRGAASSGSMGAAGSSGSIGAAGAGPGGAAGMSGSSRSV